MGISSRVGIFVGLGAALSGAGAQAQEDSAPKTWDEYQSAHSLTCTGPLESLPAPDIVESHGYRFEFNGYAARVRRRGGRAVAGEVRLGVLSGIKDFDPATRTVLESFLSRFRDRQVEGLIVGGDSAENEEELGVVFAWLAATDLPVYAISGNWEGRARFNRAMREASQGHPNLINLNLVRRLDAEGFDIVSLGGYFDRNYAKTSGVCIYGPGDAASLVQLAKQSDDPVILLTHGPPRQAGKSAIDFVPGAGNVGDPALASVIKEAHIPFGVHGHILEAGGHATDAGGKPLAEGKLHSSLFLNPGAANPLPWKLNSGGEAHGLAAILTLRGKAARFEVLRAPEAKEGR